MTPALTFVFGLVLLILFGLYFLIEKESTRRWIGTTLAVLLCAFCVDAFLPLEKKIHLGLDLQGGSSFLVRLVPPTDANGHPRKITPEMREQPGQGIRKRLQPVGVRQ